MDNTPETPPPAPTTNIPAAPRLLVSRPAAGAPPKPAFKPTAAGSVLPPPPSFSAPAGAGADAAPAEVNFTEDADNSEPVVMVAIDALALVASVAFAVLLFMQMSLLSGK